jgi:hypothetical protein
MCFGFGVGQMAPMGRCRGRLPRLGRPGRRRGRGSRSLRGRASSSCPAATAGVFMRASLPRWRRSWAGTRASSATLAEEARMSCPDRAFADRALRRFLRRRARCWWLFATSPGWCRCRGCRCRRRCRGRTGGAGDCGRSTEPKPNWRTRMQGMPRPMRRASTSGVMRPRSSATRGSGPRVCSRRSKSSCAGGFDPLAVDGGLFFAGDGPVGLESRGSGRGGRCRTACSCGGCAGPTRRSRIRRGRPSGRGGFPSAGRWARSSRAERRRRGWAGGRRRARRGGGWPRRRRNPC